jgi:hypothetical protein
MEVEMQKYALLTAAAALTVAAGYVGTEAIAQSVVKPRTAASMECSRQADAKGLHGKGRKHFRSRCMRDMAKSSKGGPQKGTGYR